MKIELSPNDRISFLTIMAGGLYRTLDNLFKEADLKMQERIINEIADSMAQIEPVMDMYGLSRTPEGIAKAMLLTEDLIGCEPKGELSSATENEAVRIVTSCPWSSQFSNTGSTCTLLMRAVDVGLARKYGTEVICEQTIASGSDRCIWKVRKVIK